MSDLNQDLRERLAELREQALYRELRRVDSPQSPHVEMAGRSLLNFSANDYLGLACDALLKEAAIKAIEHFGTGSGASRLICGSLIPHHELEHALAHFKGTEAALSFSSGYAAALGTITALLGREDIVVIDKLVHASVVDAARLSGAQLRVFRHNDLEDLERILRWADSRLTAGGTGQRRRVLIVTESVFSMDGDLAPLPELVALKQRHGAWLMVDEAHATGIYGANGRGLIESSGTSGGVEIQMGTLSKALGGSGGFVAGSRCLIDFLVNRARSFVFSTAPSPAAAAAAAAAVRWVQTDAGRLRRQQLWQRVDQMHQGLAAIAAGHATNRQPAKSPRKIPARRDDGRSAILPLMIGEESETLRVAADLTAAGLYVPAIRYPTVARGAARLRITVTASHTAEEVARLLAGLEMVVPRTRDGAAG
jgi:8-amino-7-oxononanoate synthase